MADLPVIRDARARAAFLEKLERVPGSARRWRHKRTKAEYSQRQIQQFKTGLGVSIERMRDLRKAGKVRAARAATARGEHVNDLLKRYARTQGVSQKAALKSADFWRAVKNLKGGKGADMSPSGPKAQALVKFGLRPPGFNKRVDLSPRVTPPVQPRTRAA